MIAIIIIGVLIAVLGAGLIMNASAVNDIRRQVKRNHRNRPRIAKDGMLFFPADDYVDSSTVFSAVDGRHLVGRQMFELKHKARPTSAPKVTKKDPSDMSMEEIYRAIAAGSLSPSVARPAIETKKATVGLFADRPDYEDACIDAAQEAFDNVLAEDGSNPAGVLAAVNAVADYFRDDERERVALAIKRAFSEEFDGVVTASGFADAVRKFTTRMQDIYDGVDEDDEA